jgi:SNF2 family DNA or RNA helicase
MIQEYGKTPMGKHIIDSFKGDLVTKANGKGLVNFCTIIKSIDAGKISCTIKSYGIEQHIQAVWDSYWKDFNYSCDCKRYRELDSHRNTECKHIAALRFTLAKQVDAEPDYLNDIISARLENWSYRLIFDPDVTNANDIFFKLTVKIVKYDGSVIPYQQAIKMNHEVSEIYYLILNKYFPELTNDAYIQSGHLLEFMKNQHTVSSRAIEVVVPKEFYRKAVVHLQVKSDSFQKDGNVSFFKLNELLKWHWSIIIDDEELNREEFEKLLIQKEEIVQFRDKYIRIDVTVLAKIIEKIKGKQTPDENDFLQAYFSGNMNLTSEEQNLINKKFINCDFPVPISLHATLRPYQIQGYNWICSNLLSGFGCILADDMGLGKTIQAITVLLQFKEQGFAPNKNIIIVPAALLENWEMEIHKFASSITVARYHGQGRDLDIPCEVLLTTYQTIVRDETLLSEYTFSIMIVDEAHLMKNANTKATKTIKKLKATYRLALSGTPVENHLEDMRSLFDFVLPGYLGDASQFSKLYQIPIEQYHDKEIAEHLQKITQPFLLRRLKTDKNIITDLPDKIITNEYAVLEKDQLALYQKIVDMTLKKSQEIKEPSKRTALVLGLLTSLKQICDHPRIYDKESPAISELSGKAILMVTLLEEILENNEKVLIFSQYVETLECLREIITNELNEKVLLYHGSMSQNERSEALNSFQTSPEYKIFLISLKAGGLGLNLTAASRIIHYDLWYNPAVENQATDRAFRIGQKRNVFVHRFIVKNSFEEKIDDMLSHKKDLIEMGVASGESWIARMSNDELKILFER